MKYIRWKAVIPLLVFFSLLSIFCIFYLDAFIKNIIVSVGESIFSAKVDVEDVKTKLKNTSLEIKGLQVADRSDPWKNLFEIEKIKFDIKFIPLLSKKFIIDEMSIEGIKWSTKRKTSGKLPPKKIKKIEKKQKKEDKDSFTAKLLNTLKQKAEKEAKDLPLLQNIEKYKQEFASIDVKKIVSEFNLESKQFIETSYEETLRKYDNYKIELQSLNINQQIKIISEVINSVSDVKLEKPEDIKILQDKLNELNVKKRSLEETYEKLKEIKSSIDKDFIDTKEIYSKINSTIDKDYKNILSKLKLPEFSKENISKMLFGEVWINRVNRIIYYIHIARKYIPQRKKEDKTTQKPRMRGIDVVFHKENFLPDLWIRKISISASTGGEGKNNENIMVLSGLATNFSSDQVIVGKPAILNLQGKKLFQEYLIECVFDRMQESPQDIIKIDIKNINIEKFKISNLEFIPEIENGKTSINSLFSLKNEDLNCEMQVLIDNVKFSPLGKTEKQEEIRQIFEDVFKSIDKVYIKAKLQGKLDSLSTEISSNIDNIVVDKLKLIFGNKLQEYQTKIRSEIETNILEQKKKFLKDYEEKRNELFKIFNEHKNSLENIKKQIEDKQKEANKQIENFNNQIKQSLEQEKKKIEEELKKRFFK